MLYSKNNKKVRFIVSSIGGNLYVNIIVNVSRVVNESLESKLYELYILYILTKKVYIMRGLKVITMYSDCKFADN